MAELVHQHTEEMINELEQLQRTKLFSPAEVKAIIKKRTRHEYKLVRRKRQKKDFLAYAQYEVDLLHLIGQRRAKTQYYFKKDEIEYTISSRIHRIFKQATAYWSSDLKLWISHALFCLKWNKKTQLSKICTRLLQIHGDKPDLWILSAKWEVEVCKSMDNGRRILMSGVKRHPDSKRLWVEFFRAELMCAEKLRRRMVVLAPTEDKMNELDKTDNKLMRGEAAMIIYRNAVQSIPNEPQFHVRFLNVAACFLPCSPFAFVIIQQIENDLVSAYRCDPFVRSALAKLRLNLFYGEFRDKGFAKRNTLQRTSDDRCFDAYEAALVDIDTEPMWTLYVECLMTLCDDDVTPTSVLGDSTHTYAQHRVNRAVNVIRRAHDRRKLPSSIYGRVVEFLVNREQAIEANRIVEEISAERDEAQLWLMKIELQLLLSFMRTKKVLHPKINDLFLNVLGKIVRLAGDQEERFWRLWMEFAIGQNRPLLAKAIATKHSAQSKPKSTSAMIALYLKWLIASRGLEEARQIFVSKISPLSTASLEHYQYMLEACQTLLQQDWSKQIFDLALSRFGSSNVDLWIKYIGYCQKSGVAADVGPIFWRAKKNLEPSLVEQFMTRYTLMLTDTAGS